MSQTRGGELTNSLSFVFRVWNRNAMVFMKSIWTSVFWIFLEPLFVLGSLGYGLGAYITNIQGLPYVDFFFPALLCNSSMMVSFFVATYDHFSKLTHQRLYETLILTPIEPKEIVLGEILWAATKGTLSALAISVVGLALGLIHSWHIIPTMIFIFLNSLVFASLGMLVTTYVKNFDQIIYPTSGLIIPMSLFSGTYFPLPHLPFNSEFLSYLLPLTHTVRASRLMLTLHSFDWYLLIHLLFLSGLTVILIRWSSNRLLKKIQK